MKLDKKIFIIVLFFLMGCADESLGPVVTFETAGKGAYVKLVNESSRLINVLSESTINSSEYTYSVEFVDLQNGRLITEYRVDAEYIPASGDRQIVSGFLTFSQSDFTDAESGNRALTGINITAPQILSAFGLSPSDLSVGDSFVFDGFLTLEDGGVFGYANSTPAVRGTAFGGHFRYTIPVACPSELEGEYEVVTTNIWCGADPVSGTVEVVPRGAGVYEFSDWSFGSYGACYGGSVATTLTFTEVCEVVTFTSFQNQFGDTYTIESSIEGNEWTIRWSNDYGEAGTSVVRYTGGDNWPFELGEW